MAVEDNLVVQIYPQSGDSVPVNIVDDSTMDTTGTPSLTTEGGEDAWLLESTEQIYDTITEHTVDGATTGTGVTFAIRFKVNTWGGSNFDRFCGFADDISTTDGGPFLGKNGASEARCRMANTSTTAITGETYTSSVRTIVVRARTSSTSAQDFIDVWYDQVSRSGTSPDFTASGQNWSSYALDTPFIQAPTGAEIVLLDYALWDVEKSDADCSAVADDYRTEMPSPTSGTTVNATSASIDVSTFAATVTVNAPTNVSATLASIDVSTNAATVTQVYGIVTEPLKNNTGTVLASTGSIIANVYNLSTGALVVRKTGLTSDANGVIQFTDASLSASTTYLVLITVGSSDGVARIATGA